MIIYIENPKDTTRKLLELINEYSKVSEYKIDTQGMESLVGCRLWGRTESDMTEAT